MTPTIEDVWEDLYQARALTLLWTLAKDGRLISASTRTVGDVTQLWIRQDFADAPTHIRMVRFATEDECRQFTDARQQELSNAGWVPPFVFAA